MKKLEVKLLRSSDRRALNTFLKLYRRSFNADERVSPSVLRRVMKPSPQRVNPVHLLAAYQGNSLIGGAVTLVLPAFSAVFGSYLFVDPELRSRGLGMRIHREVLRLERRGAQGPNWRFYIETTDSSGPRWPEALKKVGYHFFPTVWPIISYQNPKTVVPGKLGYYAFKKDAPSRFSHAAFLTYIHALFYGPDATHRHLLPRLKNFVSIDA